jgi:primosomal protein N' (replication factor Y)
MTAAEDLPGPPYAQVAVDTALTVSGVAFAPDEAKGEQDDPGHLQRTFHYAIPPPLRGQVVPGQLVWAPFGARHLQGIVVALDDASPVDETKDLLALIDAEPSLSAEQLALAQWISARYLTPLQAALFAMLPPGMQQRAEERFALASDAAADRLSPAQRELYDLLAAHGVLTDAELARLAPRKTWRQHLRALLASGHVTRTVTLAAPTVRPHFETLARLLHADRSAWSDARAKVQLAVLELLSRRQMAGSGWTRLADLRQQAGAAPATIRALTAKGLVETREVEVWRDPLAGMRFVPVTPPPLTADQEAAWQVVAADLDSPGGQPFLLQGVTGSGKTEIYLRAVERALAQGRGAIVLVPEIALTPQTIRRFGARFPELLAVMHGSLSPGERYDQWRRIRAGELRVVIGARSALFAPVRRLGVIVVDEEHEWTYKQDQQAPHYHAREAAIALGRLAGATVLLGSATPDLGCTYRAERGEFRRLELPRRIMGHRAAMAQHLAEGDARSRFTPLDHEALHADLPEVQIVDLRVELREGNSSIFSRALDEALRATLAAGEQAILFINQRGTASAVVCRDCGYVAECARCRLALAYHERPPALVCHHCGRRHPTLDECPVCGGRRIRQFGVGTERVESEVQRAYPQAVTLRWDSDTTSGRNAHERLLERFERREANVLIGTQMVAKGLDLPLVTTVGVVLADTALHLPDLFAGERTFQLLAQVAGRAGRSVLPGRVVVQTYQPEHPAIQAAAQHDYAAFAQGELAFRRAQGYPPYRQLVRLEYADANAPRAQEEAERLKALLTDRIALLGLYGVEVIGPTPPYFARQRGKWRWQLLVRGGEPLTLLRDLRWPLGWRVDVDPVTLL